MNKYKIGILKYTNEFVKTYKKNLTNIMRYSFINVEATDPTEAIQMHNEVFDNYKDVKEYLIIPKKNAYDEALKSDPLLLAEQRMLLNQQMDNS